MYGTMNLKELVVVWVPSKLK